jgi:hypothetical protein
VEDPSVARHKGVPLTHASRSSHSGIPHDRTNDKLRARARLSSTLDSPDERFKDMFESAGT